MNERYGIWLYLCMALILVNLFLNVEALRGYGHGHRKRSKTTPWIKRDTITCNDTYKYRSYDGSCNNLDHPEYGVAGTTFRRISSPKYNGDDGHTPRLKAVSGADLPSPRSISVKVHDAANFTTPATSQMLMQWSQFLDHDLTSTPGQTDPGNCCDDTTLVTEGTLHPDVTSGGPCYPIIISANDRYFDTEAARCMNFVRSAYVTDSDGVWQQYNDITLWIDGSQIYGHSEELANSLRSFTDGKLSVNTIDGEDFLPKDEDADGDVCFEIEDDDYCFLAGDHRVNVFPGLSALHTIFVRYHNYMCDRLKALHSDWDDETLYQEARRIIIAVLQSITYGEFMQQFLGNLNGNDYDLFKDDEDYAYDSSVDPTLPNVFSTAAYRFGHSLVTDSLTIGGTIYETGDLYMRPKYVLNSLKDVVEGIINEISQRADRWYSEGITDRMFEKPSEPKSGFDIVSRNIQRGRDHGLPSYNDWREAYNLSRRANFSEMDQGSARFNHVYEDVDDVDLYSGGISEFPFNGGKVGELYTAILGSQFRDLKFGDRFYFENMGDVSSFTENQADQIRGITLARVICDTVADITQIQSGVFRVISGKNPLMNCSSIRDINIEQFWKDE